MPNKFPLWKNITILLVITFGFVFASPNLYPPDPAIQLSGQSGAMQIDAAVLDKVEESLDEAGIAYFAGETDGEALLIRLQDIKLQLRAKEVIQAAMGGDYIVALNLAPTTPDWLRDLGGMPMKLGLDLSGGVHFLLEVDLASALATRLESDLEDVKTALREERIRYRSFELSNNQIVGQFRDTEEVARAKALIRANLRDLQPQSQTGQNPLTLVLKLSDINFF